MVKNNSITSFYLFLNYDITVYDDVPLHPDDVTMSLCHVLQTFVASDIGKIGDQITYLRVSCELIEPRDKQGVYWNAWGFPEAQFLPDCNSI